MNECNDPDHYAINAERSESRGLRKALIELDDKRQQLERELTAMTKQRDEAREYADKLAEGLPDGMLPKDVEVLREANLGLATNIASVTEQRDRLAEALRVATAYPLTESWYNQAIEALATLKPCD
jgi:chromosome segregation ATPase